MSQYNRTVTDSGLRIVSEFIPEVKSVSLGIWVSVGSRYEDARQNGISHFIEHMLFKGTETRSAREIAFSLESLGGTLNAFTTRENTCFFARVLDEHFDTAIDVLSDIFCNSLFKEKELVKERSVILEEIDDLEDSPAELVFDHFAETFWDSHPLGRPILGRRDTVASLERADLLKYIGSNYTADRIIVAAAGHVDHQKMVQSITDKLTVAASRQKVEINQPTDTGKRRQVFRRDGAQTHFCLGLPGVPFNAEGRYPLLLINAILGAGMASRLFQSVREKHGLAYSVYSYHDFYRDCGLFGVYLGTDATKVVQAADLVLEEFSKLKKNALTEDELAIGKSQLKGGLTLSLESSYTRMNRLARLEDFLGEFVPLEQALREIDEVTVDDVRRTASDLFVAEKVAMVALGPVEENIVENIDWSILAN